MDIGSGKGYPASALSNFAPHPFVLDGVNVASMEGFLQSLKCPYPEVQREICKLVGRAAKRRGQGYKWQRDGLLHWGGKAYDRFGPEYQALLDHAYSQLYPSQREGKTIDRSDDQASFRSQKKSIFFTMSAATSG